MPKKRVEWDENNLRANAEYQRLHPVTMHITEPKTPYVYEGDDEVIAGDEETEEEIKAKWDEKVNAFAHEIKERVLNDRSSGPVAPVDKKSGRPQLLPGTASGEVEKARKAQDFVKMRKAVYAEEGKKFKELLAKSHCNDNEDDNDNLNDDKYEYENDARSSNSGSDNDDDDDDDNNNKKNK